MTLSKFYDLISRTAEITLTRENNKIAVFTGFLKDVPDEFDKQIVVDFKMNDDGTIEFLLK